MQFVGNVVSVGRGFCGGGGSEKTAAAMAAMKINTKFNSDGNLAAISAMANGICVAVQTFPLETTPNLQTAV